MPFYCPLRFVATHFYSIWAVVGPLAGVGFGASLTARWQRKKWVLDNKLAEYRGILDALSSYRFALTEYYAKYKFAMVAVSAQKKYDDDVAFAKARSAVNNAFDDRVFTRLAVEQSGARKEWGELAAKMLADKSTSDELLKIIDSIHDKLVKAFQDDLKLHDV
ncbi:MAG: hypothetical protein WCF88_10200 [Candidatus Acidiferrales bacterium]|jgi:hypothetical protein